MINNKVDPAHVINEEELENWITGLTECSFDRGQHKKLDGPEPQVIGTEHERFVVTKLEIIKGVKLIRDYASIRGLPNKYPVPDCISEIYNRSKSLFALCMSLEFTVKTMCYYDNKDLAKREELLVNINDKYTKMVRFADTLRSLLMDVVQGLREPVIRQELLLNEEDNRPPSRINDRPARSTEGRKKSTRKSFSLSSLLDSN